MANNFEDDEEREEVATPSPLAARIKRLKDASVKASRERGRLPQPLFWSLFHSELDQIRKEKELRRTVDELLGGIEAPRVPVVDEEG